MQSKKQIEVSEADLVELLRKAGHDVHDDAEVAFVRGKKGEERGRHDPAVRVSWTWSHKGDEDESEAHKGDEDESEAA